MAGWGVFGVEFFIKGDDVWFSAVSPRPHDTGLVKLVSQDLSEFALHARAILGLPIPAIRQLGPSASCALLAHGHGVPVFANVYEHTDRYWREYALCEDLVDLATQFQLWRFRHMRTVMRIIGFKRGTGGSSGVGFLRQALELTFFPELFEVRTVIDRPHDPLSPR